MIVYDPDIYTILPKTLAINVSPQSDKSKPHKGYLKFYDEKIILVHTTYSKHVTRNFHPIHRVLLAHVRSMAKLIIINETCYDM